MSRRFPSMTALLGLLAVAGYQNVAPAQPSLAPYNYDRDGDGLSNINDPFPDNPDGDNDGLSDREDNNPDVSTDEEKRDQDQRDQDYRDEDDEQRRQQARDQMRRDEQRRQY